LKASCVKLAGDIWKAVRLLGSQRRELQTDSEQLVESISAPVPGRVKERPMELILYLKMDRNSVVGTTHQCSNWDPVRHTIEINPLVLETVSQKRVAFNHKKFLSGIVTDENDEHRS
jgi:hypothetical protein